MNRTRVVSLPSCIHSRFSSASLVGNTAAQNTLPILIVAPENMPLGHNLINLVGARNTHQGSRDDAPVAPSPTMVDATLESENQQLYLHYASLYLSIQEADPIYHRPPPIQERPQISRSVMPNISPIRISHLVSPKRDQLLAGSVEDQSATTQFFTPMNSLSPCDHPRPSLALSTRSPSLSSPSLTRSSTEGGSTPVTDTSFESAKAELQNGAPGGDVEISREIPSVLESTSDILRDITVDMDILLAVSPMGGRIQQTESMEFKGRRVSYHPYL